MYLRVMKLNLWVLGALLLVAPHLIPLGAAEGQEPDFDGNKVEEQLNAREGKIQALSIDDQLKLRAAQQKAAQDPDVLAALEKRDKAIQEFRLALRNSMIKADPKMEAILDKIAVGATPGF